MTDERLVRDGKAGQGARCSASRSHRSHRRAFHAEGILSASDCRRTPLFPRSATGLSMAARLPRFLLPQIAREPPLEDRETLGPAIRSRVGVCQSAQGSRKASIRREQTEKVLARCTGFHCSSLRSRRRVSLGRGRRDQKEKGGNEQEGLIQRTGALCSSRWRSKRMLRGPEPCRVRAPRSGWPF